MSYSSLAFSLVIAIHVVVIIIVVVTIIVHIVIAVRITVVVRLHASSASVAVISSLVAGATLATQVARPRIVVVHRVWPRSAGSVAPVHHRSGPRATHVPVVIVVHIVVVVAVAPVVSTAGEELVVENVLVGVGVGWRGGLLGVGVPVVVPTPVVPVVPQVTPAAHLHDLLKLVIALLVTGSASQTLMRDFNLVMRYFLLHSMKNLLRLKKRL